MWSENDRWTGTFDPVWSQRVTKTCKNDEKWNTATKTVKSTQVKKTKWRHSIDTKNNETEQKKTKKNWQKIFTNPFSHMTSSSDQASGRMIQRLGGIQVDWFFSFNLEHKCFDQMLLSLPSHQMNNGCKQEKVPEKCHNSNNTSGVTPLHTMMELHNIQF